MIDGMNKVSARDVAVEAGVSAPVVSWVANGTATQHRIGEATQCRVRAVIERMGYGSSRGAGAVVGCQTAELLGKSPFGQPLTTQQLDNLTTALSAFGCELVPAQTRADLVSVTTEGLVGVLYRQAVKSVGSTNAHVPEVAEQVPETPHPGPLPQGARVQNIIQGESDLLPRPLGERVGVRGLGLVPEPVVPASVVPPVDADACGEPSRTVPAASVAGETPPGTDGDGRSPSTLAAEPVTVDPVAEPVVPASVVPPVDADVPAASVIVENPPGTDGDGTSPSTLATEPIQAPIEDAAGTAATTEEVPIAVESSTIHPSTTQQLSNPTTVLPSAPIPPVAEEIPVPIPEPVAIVVPEPEAAIAEPVVDTSLAPVPVVLPETILEPVPVLAEPLETEKSVVEPSPVPEPVLSATPPSTTQQPDNPTTLDLVVEPNPAIESPVVEPVVETVAEEIPAPIPEPVTVDPTDPSTELRADNPETEPESAEKVTA